MSPTSPKQVSVEDLLVVVFQWMESHQMVLIYTGKGKNKNDLNGVPPSEQVRDEIIRVMIESRVNAYSGLVDCLFDWYTLEVLDHEGTVSISFNWKKLETDLEEEFRGINQTYVFDT